MNMSALKSASLHVSVIAAMVGGLILGPVIAHYPFSEDSEPCVVSANSKVKGTLTPYKSIRCDQAERGLYEDEGGTEVMCRSTYYEVEVERPDGWSLKATYPTRAEAEAACAGEPTESKTEIESKTK